MGVTFKQITAAVPVATLLVLFACVLTGCGGKETAEGGASGTATGAVSSKPAIPPEAQAQINAQQRRESADRAAHMPKTGP